MSTPPSAPLAPIHSTPQSKGSGSHHTHSTHHRQEDFAPYLQEDLAHQKTITLPNFLTQILHIQPDWEKTLATEINSITTTDRFRDLLKEYDPATVTLETELYRPFVALANHCLEELDLDGIRFCRDDPTLVVGSDAARKPDVVVVRKGALAVAGRDSVDNLSKQGPEGYPFHWRELLSFWEFKLERGDTVPAVAAPSQPTTSAAAPAPPAKKRKIEVPSLATRSSPRLTSGSGSGTRSKGGSDRPSEGSDRPSGSKKTKAAKTDKPKEDPVTQCASYALEMLSYGGLRAHVLGALVTNSSIELWYYDRSTIVRSESFDFKQKPECFVAILRRLASLDDEQWGYHPLVKLPEPKAALPKGVYPHLFDKVPVKFGTTDVQLADIVFQSHGLIGRGTCVIRATPSPPATGAAVILKFSWPAKSRTPEAVILQTAINYATQNKFEWVHKHLPRILDDKEYQPPDNSPQLLLQSILSEYEVRVLRIVVQEELKPVTALDTATDVAEAFRGIFKCYRWLYEYPNIMHRDISLDNLMFRIIDGRIYGVLNDFDLAVDLKAKPRSTSQQRTGTRPFMSIDLLVPEAPPRHVYRFDLESLLYAMLFLAVQYEDGKKIAKPPLQEWYHLDTTRLLKEKKAFMQDLPPKATPKFRALDDCLAFLIGIFRRGYFARADHQTKVRRDPTLIFDDETLDGLVTFDAFSNTLNEMLPAGV